MTNYIGRIREYLDKPLRDLREFYLDKPRRNLTLGLYALVLSIFAIGYPGIKQHTYRLNLIKQLRPYIETLDTKPGISIGDLEKAGILTPDTKISEEILLKIPTPDLERTLESFKQSSSP